MRIDKWCREEEEREEETDKLKKGRGENDDGMREECGNRMEEGKQMMVRAGKSDG